MRVPLFQIDAFATQLFTGNPAAVMPLPHFLPDAVLQAIAAENNVSETAFIVPQGGDYALRWFTPTVEVPLCGHATLASAAVVMARLDKDRTQVVFHTASGPLTVNRTATGYRMDPPARECAPVERPPGLADALGAEPSAVLGDSSGYLVVLEKAQVLRELRPDMAALARLPRPGMTVTARDSGQPYDFISRYFTPARGIPEDPVTGSAHCALVPYWAARLGKTSLHAFQASSRGGDVRCQLRGDRVELSGSCVFYLEGEAQLPD